MSLERISDLRHDHVPAVAHLLEVTFPEWERESIAEFLADLEAGKGLDLWTLGSASGEFLGFARGRPFPDLRRGWIVHLALVPGQRGGRRGESFLRLIRDDLAQQIPGLQGLYFEVEKVEDAHTESERQARTKRLGFFSRLGAQIVSTGYVQPPSQPGQPPVPLNLLFWGNTSASNADLVTDFYQSAFQYDEGHPHVRIALAQVVNSA